MFIPMKAKKYNYVFINLFVVGLFLFTNPFIALFLCALISSVNIKINYFIFTTSFIVSWTLYHFMRDYTVSGGDVIPYVSIFYNSINDSLFTIISNFIEAPVQNEPLWRISNKIIGYFISNSPSIFIFTIYLIIFQLVSILGYIVNKQNFAIIIFFIFFLNLGILYNIFHVWRHTIAILIFIIGIQLYSRNNSPVLCRLLIYTAPLVQLVTLPLIILFELFNYLNKSVNHHRYSGLFNKGVLIYCAIFFIGVFSFEIFFSDIVTIFNLHQFNSIHTNIATFRLFWVISPLSLMLMFSLFRSKSLHIHDIYFGVTYYLLILMLLFVNVFPAILYGRTLYALLVGVSIIVGNTFINSFKQTALVIIGIACYRFYTLSLDNIAHSFNFMGGGEPLNPFLGIITMIYHQEFFKMVTDSYIYSL
jgi:hypothetical protein